MKTDHHDILDGLAVDVLERRAIQDINPENVQSAALKRLIQDIQQQSRETTLGASAYNRMHNRHNRGR